MYDICVLYVAFRLKLVKTVRRSVRENLRLPLRPSRLNKPKPKPPVSVPDSRRYLKNNSINTSEKLH